jgi:hypothetical protein
VTKSLLISSLIASLTAGIAAPAFAGGISQGDAQVAAYLGVPAGQYSPAELTLLEQAKRDNDAQAYAFILSGGLADRVSTSNGASQGDTQLANTLGVTPGAYSLSDLIALQDARKDGDAEAAKAILGHDVTAADGAGTVTPGKAALAAQLGVNPADYSLSQLSAMMVGRITS